MPEDGWSFLNDGVTTLRFVDTDWYQQRSPCTAIVELISVTIEVDFSPAVAIATEAWGTVKARYR